jgi:tetratricopeptide (TPR) repeat protein
MKKFIGRVKEKRIFTESVSRILEIGKKGPISRFKKKPEEEIPFPRLFLFYGEGGLGKSMLLDECIRVAEDKAKEKGEKIKIIKLDWDDYYNKKSTLPDDDIKMIKGLYTVFRESVEKSDKYFEEYIKKQEEVDAINEKVEEKRKDFSKEAEFLTKAGKIWAGTQGIPVPDEVGEVLKEGLSYAFSTMHEFELKFRRWLREKKTLPEKDITLYENSNYELSKALINGFIELSNECPVILAMDTYEQVDKDRVEDWFRTIFLKRVFECQPRILVILSGRNNHLQQYRKQFPDDLLEHTSFDDILFTENEVKEFTEAYGLDIKEDDIKRMRQRTHSIPLVVEDVCISLKNGKPLNEALEGFEAPTEQKKNIIKGVVDQFLKYCDSGTKERVFYMAMLRQFNDELLSKIWNVSTKETNEILSEMSERHSFISRHRMHAQVRHFIRNHLVNEIKLKSSSHVFEGFGKYIIDLLSARLEEMDKRYELLEELYTDEDFQSTFLDYINILIWVDRNKAFYSIRKKFLELLEFNQAIIFEVLKIIDEIKPCLKAKQTKIFNIWKDGFFQNILFTRFANITGDSEQELLKFFEDCRKSLSDIQKQLLSYKWAGFYFRSGNNDKVMHMLPKTHGLMEHSAIIKKKIPYLYNNTGERYHNKKKYCKALNCCNEAIKLDPEFGIGYHNRGVLHHSLKEYGKALDDFTKAIELNPKDEIAFYGRGNTYAEIRKIDKAISDYTKAININPENALIYKTRANTYYDQQKYEQAISDYKKAIKLDPGDAGVYNNRGNAYDEIKEFDKAISDYEKAIELNPEYTDAYTNRGNSYMHKKEYYKAIADHNKAIELNSENAKAYYNRGIVYNKLKEYDNAIADYSKAIETNPHYLEAYGNRGNSYVKKGEYDKAIADYSEAIQMNPKDARNYSNRGNTYSKQQKYDKAIIDCNKAIELNPEYAEAYNNRGTIFFNQEKYDKAMADYNKSIEINPKYAFAYSNRGNVYNKNQQYEKAIVEYDKAVALNPEFAGAYNNRGALYSSQQKYDKALDDYNKAIELKPEYVEAYNNRGYLFLLRKEYDKALENCEMALELNPNNAKAYCNRGNTYNRLKDFDKAIGDYSKAIELNPEFEEAYSNRGSSYFKKNENEKAIEDYNNAIRINPVEANYYINRGSNYQNQNKYEKAISDYNKAIQLNPEIALAYQNLAELYIIISDNSNALEIIEKASSLKLEIKDRAIYLYLECIAKKMIGIDVSECERQFNQIINEDFTTTWSFDEIEAWLQRQHIPEDKKAFINEKTYALKKHTE